MLSFRDAGVRLRFDSCAFLQYRLSWRNGIRIRLKTCRPKGHLSSNLSGSTIFILTCFRHSFTIVAHINWGHIMDVDKAMENLRKHIALKAEMERSQNDPDITELMQAIYTQRFPNKSFPTIDGWFVDVEEGQVFLGYGTDNDAQMVLLSDVLSLDEEVECVRCNNWEKIENSMRLSDGCDLCEQCSYNEVM